MLETSESLLPKTVQGQKLKVLGVGSDAESLEELDQLLMTLGVDPQGHILFSERKAHPGTYLGIGKLEEIKTEIEAKGIDAAIFDLELSPNQLKNIEKILGKPVLDRPGVIIEIFSAHARTKEAKTQVELARLQYLLPRLTHFWTHFERQRGGIGNKGMGESQIEVDRRLVKKRMSILKDRLKQIEKERGVRRDRREDLMKVALVGYTNAGKSTLLNSLTHSHVLTENKLFATLDPSVRALSPNSHPPVVAVDTVGFIKKLPPSLVASFRSTLEELQYADLLVHVVDGSSLNAREQFEVTEAILKDLGLEDKPRMTVLNKSDLIKKESDRNWVKIAAPGAVIVSALNSDDAKKLREKILSHFEKKMQTVDLVVPYSESKLEAQLHAYGKIENKKHLEKGTFYRVLIEDAWIKKLELERFKT